MNARFVLDGWSWAAAAGGDAAVLSNAVHQLLERLDVARERNEGVVKHKDYYETDLGDGVQLYSALFEPNCPVGNSIVTSLSRAIVTSARLSLALDRVIEFDDIGLLDYDAEFEGSVRFAPGVAWAHACCSERRQVADLPLPLGRVPRGQVPVTVAGATVEIVFVTEESQHVHFFRSVIALENADEAMFERLARSAFPALEWADDGWHGLRRFSRPYIDVRDELVRYLGGLNDYGAACFHEHRAGDPRQLPLILSAKVGTETSDENGATKGHPPSERDRTRRHRGTNKVFWWHVKLRPHVDRIHFLYEPPSMGSRLAEHGRIVVGLFKNHCILPN